MKLSLAKCICILRTNEKGKSVIRTKLILRACEDLKERLIECVNVFGSVATPMLVENALFKSTGPSCPNNAKANKSGVGNSLDGLKEMKRVSKRAMGQKIHHIPHLPLQVSPRPPLADVILCWRRGLSGS